MVIFAKLLGYSCLVSIIFTIPCYSDDDDFILFYPEESLKISLNEANINRKAKKGLQKEFEEHETEKINDEIDKTKEDRDSQKLNPEATKHIIKALDYELDKESLGKQIEEYNAAIKIDPDYSRVYLYLAKCYYKNGNYGKAIANYSKAIELEPNYYLPYEKRALAYACRQLYSLALEDYNNLIKLNPNKIYYYYNRCCIYGKYMKYEEAVTDFSKAIEIGGDNIRLGFRNAKSSRYADYVVCLSFDNYITHCVRGWSYYQMGKTEEAIEDLENAIKLESRYDKSYYYLGNINSDLKKFKEAIRYYTKAIDLNQNFIKAYINRGLVYQQMGFKKYPCDDFKKACELGDCDHYNQAKENGDCE